MATDMKCCSDCKENKTISNFHKGSYYCKDCANTRARKWHKENIHKPEVKRAKRNGWLKRAHGITLQQYEEKLVAQGNKCAICDLALLPFGYGTHLDHDHQTGQHRDFLCTNCNRGLGSFHDNPNKLQKAIDYLNTHNNNVNVVKEVTPL